MNFTNVTEREYRGRVEKRVYGIRVKTHFVEKRSGTDRIPFETHTYQRFEAFHVASLPRDQPIVSAFLPFYTRHTIRFYFNTSVVLPSTGKVAKKGCRKKSGKETKGTQRCTEIDKDFEKTGFAIKKSEKSQYIDETFIVSNISTFAAVNAEQSRANNARMNTKCALINNETLLPAIQSTETTL